MAKHKSTPKKAPRRGEIWYIEDKDKRHDEDKRRKSSFHDSVQCGTRYCIIVSNDTGNRFSPVVEIVYVTTKKKSELPTHFLATSTPKPSTVLCEQIMTVPKESLTHYHGMLTKEELIKLNKCLKISLNL